MVVGVLGSGEEMRTVAALQRTVLGFVVLFVVLLFRVGSLTAQEPVQPAEARTLTIAVPADIISLDPARISRHSISEAVQGALYRPMLQLDAQRALYLPGVVKRFHARDELTWEFEVADRVIAEGLARYFRRVISPEGISGFPAPARERLAPAVNATAEGNKLIVHLSEPMAGFPSALVGEPAVRLSDAGTLQSTGAFELERWDHGNRVVLRRFGEAPPGGFDRLWFEVVPSADERLRRLIAGEVDIALGLPPDGYWRLRLNRGVVPVVTRQTRVHFMELNVKRPPFDDVRVRRAVNLAVDVREMIRTVMQDQAEPIATIFSPVTLGYEPSVVPFGHDRVRARELLAEAGYPNGFELELDVTRSRRRVAEAYKSMLADVGIRVVVREWESWSALYREIELGRRHAWLNDWDGRGFDAKDVVWDKLHSDGEKNYGGYTSEALDSLLELAERTLDPEQRLEHYRLVQRYLRQEAPFLFGYVEYTVYGASDELEWHPGPGSLLALDEITRR